MEKYVSLLRGINVGGKKKIKMADLKSMYELLGFENVVTYIQSGNVVFNYKKTALPSLENLIQEKIKTVYDFDVSVLIKKEQEIAAILANNPFLQGKRQEEIKQLYLTFLAEKPSEDLVLNLKKTTQSYADEWIIKDKNIYLFFPNGYGTTKLSNNFFERKLKVAATTRNWRTTCKLMELLEGI